MSACHLVMASACLNLYARFTSCLCLVPRSVCFDPRRCSCLSGLCGCGQATTATTTAAPSGCTPAALRTLRSPCRWTSALVCWGRWHHCKPTAATQVHGTTSSNTTLSHQTAPHQAACVGQHKQHRSSLSSNSSTRLGDSSGSHKTQLISPRRTVD